MKKISLFLGMFLLLSLTVNAQYAFKVLAAKGSNQILTKGTWTKLTAGTRVNKGEKLKLPEGGYLGLIHNSGKTLELKKSGTFEVSQLESKIISGKSNFGAKYSSFVADGMFAANEDAKNNYDRTGSVHRGIAATSIVIYAPKKTIALKNEPLQLNWNKCGEDHIYTVTLTDYFGVEVYSTETNTNFITLDFNSIDLKVDDEMIEEVDDEEHTSYLLTVQSKTNPEYISSSSKNSENYEIQIIDEDKEKKIAHTIKEVKSQIDNKSAMDQMVLAAAYEKEGLMTYALESYKKAKELAPEVEHFNLQYEEYIKTKLGIETLKGRLDK